MSPTRHASKIGIPRAFLLVSVDSLPVDSSSSASSAAYNSSSSASSNVSKDDATVTPSDIGATSVLAEEHLGKPRLRSVVDALNAPRFRPAHRVSPVVRAAGPNDAHWTGDETDVRDGVRDCSDEARTFRRRLTAPDALVSAWHVDTPTLADADHTIVSAVLGNGGTHVLAAAPGLFAFARAARRPRREGEDEDEDDSSDARAEEESASDSDEDARVLRSDVPSTGIWNERRFRDARLARAPVSLVESVVPADDDDATRLETKPKRRSLLFFVTVCDANAHGLREGDGVAFIDPLAEDTDDVARGRGAEPRDPLTERARSRARRRCAAARRRARSAPCAATPSLR